MGRHYGQTIIWGPLSAPRLFTGEIMSYRYGDKRQEQLIAGATGSNLAVAIHSQKAQLNYEAKVTSGTNDFLLLSDDAAAIAVDGINTGIVLVEQAVEKWRLGKEKTASIQAIHFPDIVQANPTLAAVNLNAFTPDQSGLQGLIYPNGQLIYGTYGFGHASGVVHAVTLTQTLTIQADDPSPDGKILGAASYGYMRRLQIEVLAKGAIPATDTVLALEGAPAHALNYRITSAEKLFEEVRGTMYQIDSIWIPTFGNGQ